MAKKAQKKAQKKAATSKPTQQEEPVDAFGDYLSPEKLKEGWDMLQDAVDPLSPNMSPEQIEARDAQLQTDYEFNKSIHNALSTPDGQVLFNWMRELGTEGQRFSIFETDAKLAAAKGFFREGQAAFYFEVKRRRKAALQGPPAATD